MRNAQSVVLLFKLSGEGKVKESSMEQCHWPEHHCETPVQSCNCTLAYTESSCSQQREALLIREMLVFLH